MPKANCSFPKAFLPLEEKASQGRRICQILPPLQHEISKRKGFYTRKFYYNYLKIYFGVFQMAAKVSKNAYFALAWFYYFVTVFAIGFAIVLLVQGFFMQSLSEWVVALGHYLVAVLLILASFIFFKAGHQKLYIA